jgi:UDP-N-acetylmuramate: L-alanyl-gamma-D-glutamyl-meso-diaminopimelate ligase
MLAPIKKILLLTRIWGTIRRISSKKLLIMRLHFLGICGTFMGSLAVIAKQLGHEVTGSDEHVYPPMSTELSALGIDIFSGFTVKNLSPTPDLIIIGNAIRRGNPEAEYILNNRLSYASGPEWLAKTVLQYRKVLAVAGTHGKTTTTAMLAWILQCAGLNPGYLIGGVPLDFPASANLGEDPFFVIEADEYDTAFFDKRSKFIQYHTDVAILNNLEFDHGDIFRDLEAIKIQFSHLIRTLPNSGLIIYPPQDANLCDVIARSCWTPTTTFGLANANWQAKNISEDMQQFDVMLKNETVGTVKWKMLGKHNILNALAAVAAAAQVGVMPSQAIAALNTFSGVKKRLEIKGQVNGITVYDDFAHHPTAIAATIQALRAKVKHGRIIAVLEFASNTMRAGLHGDKSFAALNGADVAFVLRPPNVANYETLAKTCRIPLTTCDDINALVSEISKITKSGDHILVMSNRDFGGLHDKLLLCL